MSPIVCLDCRHLEEAGEFREAVRSGEPGQLHRHVMDVGGDRASIEWDRLLSGHGAYLIKESNIRL